MADRFDAFTGPARQVLIRAQEEAQRLHQRYVGTEHLLLGLLHGESGVAGQVLAQMGVALSDARRSVAELAGAGAVPYMGILGLSERAKHALELAVDEANRRQHAAIGPEHLLLGMLRDGEGRAIGILVGLGVLPQDIRERLHREMGKAGA